MRQVPLRSVYNYFHYDRHENVYFPQRTVNIYFLYHRRVPLLPMMIMNDYTA